MSFLLGQGGDPFSQPPRTLRAQRRIGRSNDADIFVPDRRSRNGFMCGRQRRPIKNEIGSETCKRRRGFECHALPIDKSAAKRRAYYSFQIRAALQRNIPPRWKYAAESVKIPEGIHGGSAMMERTGLVMVGKKTMVPRLLKRALQIVLTVAITSSVLLLVIVGNGFLVGKAPSFQSGLNIWLAFIRRPDILSTMILTAAVAVAFLYWQRNQERKVGGSSRSG
ncbi:MAG: hypothetical protein AB7E81_04540 [Hyphomicrobiaceae bacterium]